VTKNLSKRSYLPDGPYCCRCYIRIAIGERQVVRNGKAYHQQCEAKLSKSRQK
jgi:hypothetical protein